jgi:hypothetical protein
VIPERVVTLQEWLTDLFKMISKDGYSYGRGHPTNKAPLARSVTGVPDLGTHEGGLQTGLHFEGEQDQGALALSGCDQGMLLSPAFQEVCKVGMCGMLCLSIEVHNCQRENLHSQLSAIWYLALTHFGSQR